MAHVVILDSEERRRRAASACWRAPPGTVAEFQVPKRTLSQNAHLWAILTEVSAKADWLGEKLPAEDWKLLFMDALNRELRVVPSLDGKGFVNLGRSSAKLSKEELSDLIDLIYAWCAQRGVELENPRDHWK